MPATINASGSGTLPGLKNHTMLEANCKQLHQHSMESKEVNLAPQNRTIERKIGKRWIQHLLEGNSIVTRGLSVCLRATEQPEHISNEKYSSQNFITKSGCSSSSWAAKQSLIVSIMLPFLLLFLLPTFRLEPAQESAARIIRTTTNVDHLRGTFSTWSPLEQQPQPQPNLHALPSMSELLLSLIKFPFDRLRLGSLGLLSGIAAKEMNNLNNLNNNIINRQNDLQEEETHMLIMAPAEHRTSFLAPAQQIPTGYQQVSRSTQRLSEQPHPGYQGQLDPAAVQMAPSSSHLQHQADLHSAGDYAGGASSESGLGPEGSQGVGSVEGGVESAATSQAGGGSSLASGSSGLQTRGDLPSVRALNVKCEKNHMTVNIVFDRPFYGMVFSKGHYNDQKCVHLPANSGQTSINFDIHLGKCGMTSSDASVSNLAGGNQLQAGANQQPNGLYIENIIIIQYDPQVQEIYDQARKLRCTWYDYYEKSVTFRPYNVDMLDAVTANFLGDNIQCWMQIQVGKGPWSSEVAGIVKIGQTMTMVLAIKDDENKFDMLVRNCVAHDGKHQPIQLVDEYGCVARPKIMAKFQKVRNFGPAATVVSYAHFQAFKFPDSMSVHFQCVIQVCRFECPEPVCNAQSGAETNPNLVGGGPSALSGSGTDYAASGTELVASKEALPSVNSNIKLAPTSHNANSVNLKLDEAQGRVQVKLDTSMMTEQQQRAQSGPLPPHLLHTVSSERGASETGAQAASRGTAPFAIGRGGHTFMSSSYAGTSKAPTSGLPTSGSGRAPGGRAQMAPSNVMQPMHYSSPYPQVQRSGALAYVPVNRLGDLPADGSSALDEEDESSSNKPLVSMFGSPRALLSTPNVSSIAIKAPASNHRYRRSTENSTTASMTPRSGKSTRSAPNESTAIQTQKTIQVVSPDDVAFSLLSDELEPLTISAPHNGRGRFVKQANLDDLSKVCFSATRLMCAVLVTLALVATSIVIVTFVILRQRSINRSEESKLSPVYEIEDSLDTPGHYESKQSNANNANYFNNSRQVADKQHYLQRSGPSSELYDQDTVAEMLSRRQREEIHQRNNYLARLYSQFSPATYWR